jgi:ubiquinone/menaquinone biosynthesis C-methylase UbiE
MIIPSIPELKERLDAGIKVLDVGCGGGDLMIQLAKDFPRCSFVGTEIDRFVIEDTRRHLEDNGVEDRTSVTLVDAASMEYDGEFDLVNMAVVLHEIRPNTRYRSIAN